MNIMYLVLRMVLGVVQHYCNYEADNKKMLRLIDVVGLMITALYLGTLLEV